MSTRIERMTFPAVATSVVLFAPLAMAAESPRCAEVAVSARAEPDWYADECLGGVRPEAPAAAPGPWLVPGDTQCIMNHRTAGPFPDSLTTAPVPTLNYTLVGPQVRSLFALDFDLAASVLWAIDDVSRELGTLDQTTGVFTPSVVITGVPAGRIIGGLKFDPTSSIVYLATDTGLFTLNITTGVATPIGLFGGGVLVVDIAISNSGQMYAHDIALDNLLRVDKATGAATIIGPTGALANFAQGMDFDASDNTLYAYIYTGAGANRLSTFDLTTGAATTVVTGVTGPENEGAIKALALAPAALAVDASGNGVLQPNETAVVVAPSWRNPNFSAVANVAGVLSNFTGPAGPVYTINDSAASYGTIPAATTQSCGASCYAVTVTSATRPATHWDGSVLETVNPSAITKTWRLHVGDSFTDVPPSNGFYRFIETILHKNVTGGCTPTTYCPANSTTRAQMAVFVLVSREPAGYTPPPCGATPQFPDVPVTSPFCPWVEELFRRGVVGGCGSGNYCPSSPATREQMAVFVLRTLDPALNPPACTTPVFNDVPAASPFCRWIEELVRRGVVSGCGGGNYCPTANVTRAQMSVFLAGTFGLVLYGL